MSDLIITARKIYFESGKSDFIHIKNGKIFCMGSKKEAEKYLKTGIEKLDFSGYYVFPGFIDSHTHFVHTGLNLGFVSLKNISSNKDVAEKMFSKRCRNDWVIAYGYDETKIKEGKKITVKELDKINDRKIVIIRIDYHSLLLNSKALGEVKSFFKKKLCDDNGWVAGKDAMDVYSVIYKDISLEEKKEAIKRAVDMALSKGVTTVHALEGGGLFGNEDIEVLDGAGDKLPLNIVLYPQTMDIDWVMKKGFSRIGGCLLVDGSFGSHTAAVSKPYKDKDKEYGMLYFKKKELYEFIKKAHKNNLQVALHAIGDRGIKQAVDCMYDVIKKYGAGKFNHRLEHFELPGEESIEKASKCPIFLSMQPAFEHLWGGKWKMYYKRLGERIKFTNPLRTLFNKGFLLAGGSDSDVTPIDPLLGIHSAVNHPNFFERLDRGPAIDMFTENGAKIAYLNDRGKIKKGFRADLVVLNKDPLEVKKNEIKDIKVVATLLGGKVVYRNEKCLKN